MAIQFSNLASTTLASGVSSSATSVSVTSASLFPTLGGGDYFYATLGAGTGSEIVKVTAISGTTFTVIRGQDDTTAVSHSAGVDCALRVTAAALEDLRDSPNVESVSKSGDIMTGNLSLGQNNKAIFNSQLEVYGDGSNSHIKDTSSGNLNISGNDIQILNAASNEAMAYFAQDGDVTLYHNGSPKIATASTGINVTGSVTADSLTVDNITIDGNDISTTNSNGNLTITPNGTGNVNINSDTVAITAAENESASLILASDEADDNPDLWRFRNNTDNTLTVGNQISGSSVDHITITPNATVTNSIAAFAGKITAAGSVTSTGLTVNTGSYGAVGAGSGRMYGSSAHGLVIQGSGTTNDFLFLGSDGSDSFRIANNGDISFYEDTGTTPKLFWDASAERLTIGNDLKIFENGDGNGVVDGGDNLRLRATNDVKIQNHNSTETLARLVPNGAVTLYYDNSPKIATTSTGIDVTGSVTSTNTSGLGIQTSGYSFLSAANNARAASGSLRLGNGTAGTGFVLDYTDQGQTVATIRNAYNATNASELTIQSPFITFDTGTSYTEALKLDHNQNANIPNGGLMVGSTTVPSARLEVHGAFAYASGANSLATTVSKASARIRGSSDASTSLFFGSLTNDAEQYIQSSNGSGTGADDLALNPYGGNVGIGVPPASGIQLHIGNNANSSAVTRVTNGTTSVDLTASSSGKAFLEVGSNHPLILATNAQERMEITTSGYIHMAGASDVRLTLGSQGTAGNNDANWIRGNGTSLSFNSAAGNYIWEVGGSPKMTLLAGGDLLVGKTEDGTSVDGHVLFGNGAAYHIRNGGFTNFFNRTGSSGEILRFAQDGTSVGSIGCYADKFYIGDGDTGICFVGEDDVVLPCSPSSNNNRDNAITLGAAAVRFKDLYLSGTANVGVSRITGQNLAHSASTLVIGHEGSSKSQLRAYGANSSTTGSLEFMVSNSSGTGSHSMTLTSGGSLLVGKTTTAIGTQGIRLEGNNGKIEATRSGNVVTAFNRTSSDGTISEWMRDGATVGAISVIGGNNLTISGTQANHCGLSFATNAILPATESATNTGVVDLGATSEKFKDLHLSHNMNATNAYLGSGNEIGWGGTYSQGKPTISGTSGGITFYGAGITSGLSATITSGGILLLKKTSTSVNVAGGYIDGGEAIMSISSGQNTYLVRNTDTATYSFYVTGAGHVNAGKGHFKTASSGASADVSADELVVESNGNAGISILSGQSNSGSIYFGDAGVNYDGYIAYSQNSRSMTFGTAAGSRMTIDSGGHTSFTLGTNAMGTFGDSIGEVGSGNFALQVTNSAGSALKPLGFRAEDIRFATGSSERLRITSTGSVDIYGSASGTEQFRVGNSTGGTDFGITVTENSGVVLNSAEGGSARSMTFSTGGSPKMTLQAGGDLLVGKTALEYENTAGHIFRNDGLQSSIRDGGNVADFNRTGSSGTEQGEVIRLSSNGLTVGSIGTAGNQSYIHGASGQTGLYWGSNNVYPYRSTGLNDATIDLGQTTHRFKDLHLSHCAKVPYIGALDVGLYFRGSYNAVVPYRPDTDASVDNYLDLGMYSHRWDDVFATNGTIQTSDRNEKQDITELSDAEQRVAVACKGLMRKFRWKSAVADKGDDARIHFGIIAQDLQAAFEAEGLDAGRYAMFTSDTWTENGVEKTRLGIRYAELLAFIISAI